MTRMAGPDCAVMCNLINTHTHTHTVWSATSYREDCLMCRPSNTVIKSDDFFFFLDVGGLHEDFKVMRHFTKAIMADASRDGALSGHLLFLFSLFSLL